MTVHPEALPAALPANTDADRQALSTLQLSALPLVQLVDHILGVLEAAVDPETGEVDAGLDAQLEAMMLSFERKCEAYAGVYERLCGEADELRRLSKVYGDRANVRTNAAKRLRDRLHQEFDRLGKTKLKTPTATIWIQASAPSVELFVLDDSQIPDEFCVVERRASSSKIAKALKAGVKLSFAALTQSKHLRFR